VTVLASASPVFESAQKSEGVSTI